MNRDELYDKINNRVDHMISQGLVEEVKSLINFKNVNALNTVGYKELFLFIFFPVNDKINNLNVKREIERLFIESLRQKAFPFHGFLNYQNKPERA